MMKMNLSLWAVSLLMLFLCACSGPPQVSVQGECLSDEQCPAGQMCSDDYLCVPAPGFGGDVDLPPNPDGDAKPDGDTIPDGDTLPDGDGIPDGDYVPDGDLEITWPHATLNDFSVNPEDATPVGRRLTLIAQAETTSGELAIYDFSYRRGVDQWVQIEDQSIGNSRIFVPESPGMHTFRVRVKDPGSQHPAGFDDESSILHTVIPSVDGDVDGDSDGDISDGDLDGDQRWPTVLLETFTVTPRSPTAPGQDLLLFAYADDAYGNGGSVSEYRFQYRERGQQWQDLSSMTPLPSAIFTPRDVGSYTFRVLARHMNSQNPQGYDDYMMLSHEVVLEPDGDLDGDIDGDLDGDINDPRAEIVYFRAEPSDPAQVGDTVFLNTYAVSSGGSVQYRYSLRRPQGPWAVVLNYPGSPVHSVTLDAPGRWSFMVEVRDAASPSPVDDSETIERYRVEREVDGDQVEYDCFTGCRNIRDCGYLFPGSPAGSNMQECMQICRDSNMSPQEIECLSTADCNDVINCVGLDGDIDGDEPDGDEPDGDEPEYDCFSSCLHLGDCGYLFPGSPAGSNMQECMQTCRNNNLNPQEMECLSTADCDQIFSCLGLDGDVDGDEPDGDWDNPECDDGNPCTFDQASANGRCTHTDMPNGTTCNDGNLCTEADRCMFGTCVGPRVDCEDYNSCTRDFCDENAGGCVFEPRDDRPCSDGLTCTVQDACLNGTCVGKPAECGDGNSCTQDLCREPSGCYHQPAGDGVICDDGNDCSQVDRCLNGVCTGEYDDECDNSNPCVEERFDPLSCQCVSTPLDGKVCEDGNPCTLNDRCLSGQCRPGDATVSCEDNNVCTTDRCDPNTGSCRHDYNDGANCDAGLACTRDDACFGGHCLPGQTLNCDDGNDCTLDQCTEPVGCGHGNAPDGSACDDHDPSTSESACLNGVCVGDNPPCSSDGDCPLYTYCDPQSGLCLPGECDENRPCDAGFVCNESGSCVEMTYDCVSACEHLEDCGYLYPGSLFGDDLQGCIAFCHDYGFSDAQLECASTIDCDAVMDCLYVDGDVDGDMDGDVDGDMDGDIDLNTDYDGDGIPDDLDNCPEKFNPNQNDRDNDDVGDVCDNCIAADNPDQRDSDQDGQGNACDPTPFQANVCVEVDCSENSECWHFALSCPEAGYCSIDCQADYQCPAPWSCKADVGLCGCPEPVECPIHCSTASQCPDELGYCADVYGFDDIKECSSPCEVDNDCPAGYGCHYGNCVCSDLPNDRCVQENCNAGDECSALGWDLCLEIPWEPIAICTSECGNDQECPYEAMCMEGLCICEEPPPPVCNYGSCFTDQNCFSAYGDDAYCTGPWWPLYQRYCTKDCRFNLDCIESFGTDYFCNDANQCECRD